MTKDNNLIDDIKIRDGAVDFPGASGIFKQIENVGDGRGNPTTALIEKLAHSRWRIRPSVRRGAILHAPT